ncbi:MAG TPA: oxidoreductase [Fontimonas sp.]
MMANWTTADIPSQRGRVAIVTGANSGIGLETTVALAAAGARVVMACRSADKAAAALEQVRRRAPQGEASVLALDLASQASVHRFAESFLRDHDRLDLLINNAGILGAPLGYSVDGFENHMAANHFGHFSLTGLLIERLLATPGARIVTVGSLGHWRGKLDPDDLAYRHTPYTPFAGYCNSKLANLLFVFELSRRLQARGAGVIAAAGHPGGADTNIQKKKGTFLERIHERTIEPLARRLVVNTAAAGALPTLYAATMPDVQQNDYYGPQGFFGMKGGLGKAGRQRRASDAELARRLWEQSAQLTGVRYLD